MKDQRGSIAIILLAILALLAIGAGAYYEVQQKAASSVPLQTGIAGAQPSQISTDPATIKAGKSPEDAPIAPLQDANWKTYTSTQYGFSVSYPAYLDDSISSQSSVYLSLPPPPAGHAAPHASLDFEIDRNSQGATLEQYYKDEFGFASTPKADIRTITLGGKPAIDYAAHTTACGSSADGCYVPENIFIVEPNWFFHVTVNNEDAFNQYAHGLVPSILASVTFQNAPANDLLQSPPCKASILTGSIDGGEGAGHFVGDVVLTNVGTTTCTLEGYPTLQFEDADSRSLPIQEGRDQYSVDNSAAQKVWIEPKSTASVGFSWTNGCMEGREVDHVILTFPDKETTRIDDIGELSPPRCDEPSAGSYLSVGSFRSTQ